MLIGVGSKNPVKVEAVRVVMEQIWGSDVKVVGVGVKSGVREQPWGDEETIIGATNRARQVLDEVKEAEFGVGLEGGVYEQGGKLMECAWCVVVDRKGKVGLGGGLRFELPPIVATKIRAGGELGPIMNELLHRDEVKQQEGAVGVLTKKRVTRQSAYETLVNLAWIKFDNLEWWQD